MLTGRYLAVCCWTSTAVSAGVAALPEWLARRGWWSPAYATDADVVLDTYNGLAGMVWPGNDARSVAQREWNDRPAAMAAHVGRHLIMALDGIVPQPATDPRAGDDAVLLSGLIASAVNSVALQVNPAVMGAFLSPFSRLSFADKVTVWGVLEEEVRRVRGPDPTAGVAVLRYVVGLLPALAGSFACPQSDVFDPATGSLTRRPEGWDC